jgi:hypothetical protein
MAEKRIPLKQGLKRPTPKKESEDANADAKEPDAVSKILERKEET